MEAQVLPGTGVQLSVLGNLGNSYALLASSNLTDWTAILKFTCTNVPTLITDPASTNLNRRFYRIAPLSAIPGPTLRFASPFKPGTNQITLALDGVSGFTYRVDMSTNLIDWTVLTNFPGTTPTRFFQDSLNGPRRFYRVVGQ